MTRTRKLTLAALAAVLLAAPALACMGTLVHTEIVMGGVVCTYQLSNGQRVRVSYPDTYACPFCLE